MRFFLTPHYKNLRDGYSIFYLICGILNTCINICLSRILLVLLLPGQIIFVYCICMLRGSISVSPMFLFSYCMASLLQVWLNFVIKSQSQNCHENDVILPSCFSVFFPPSLILISFFYDTTCNFFRAFRLWQ